MEQAKYALAGHPLAMLTEIYFEALLVDKEVADRVWEAWDAAEIDDQVAWRLISSSNLANPLLQLGNIRIKPNPPKYGDGKLRALASSGPVTEVYPWHSWQVAGSESGTCTGGRQICKITV